MSADHVGQLLRERVKELTALHRTARILQQHGRADAAQMREIVALLPEAWQYPEVAVARIRFRGLSHATPGFAESQWMQRASIGAGPEGAGEVAVAYLAERPPADEGPFLAEERELIDSVADMLSAHVERRLADEAASAARQTLAAEVDARTADLRRLASELTLTEARQRRALAVDLHDHVGQALALMKQRVRALQGNAIFSGHADNIDEVLCLLDMTIRYTRDLTSQISPPVLYELGLEPALDWLAERLMVKQNFHVRLASRGAPARLPEAHQVMLYQSVRELLTNSLKYSGTGAATLDVVWSPGSVSICVRDGGVGFDPAVLTCRRTDAGFGLFSVRERLQDLGGHMTVTSAPGGGCTVVLEVPTTAPGADCAVEPEDPSAAPGAGWTVELEVPTAAPSP